MSNFYKYSESGIDYEITMDISFPGFNKIYQELYDKSTPILWRDLPDEKYVINLH